MLQSKLNQIFEITIRYLSDGEDGQVILVTQTHKTHSNCCFVSFPLPDPHPAHLEPLHQVTDKARVDLYPSTR